MHLRDLLVFFLICVCTNLHAQSHTEKIVVYVEDALPFAYLENEKVSSPYADYVRVLMRHAGYDPDIRLLSWAGIMHTAEADQPVIFFPLARTRERETKYVWLGTLIHFHQYQFYKLKARNDIRLKNLNDAKKYRIGAIEGDAREQYLIDNGFRHHEQSGLTNIVNNKDGIRLLQIGRIELLPLSIDNFKAICRPDCANYEIAFPLNLHLNLELAANKATPKSVTQRIIRAYDDLEKNGTRSRLLVDH
ncbi:substrate-binding periplasmic protein [Undibacterium sp. SXout20W]|uniref:substrate-binding periplasmic protein n=1 Tax=Undibacterium sp. SXout20W TaxID=3413051 RepID=UPI003BF1558F